MAFIITLIAVIVERYWDSIDKLRNFHWFATYQSMLNKRLASQPVWTGYIKLIGYVVPVALIVFLVYALLCKMFSVGAYIFAGVVIIYCLGPVNLYTQAKKCVIKNADGSETLAVERFNSFFGFSFTEDGAESRLAFAETVLSLANLRLFAVIFWFVILGPILGPVGAVLYRLINVCAETNSEAKLLQDVLDAIPARLLSLGYALTGNFIAVMPVLLSSLFSGLDHNTTLLKACGRAAFGIKEGEVHKAVDPSQVISLLDRTAILWLVVLALLLVL